MNRPNAGAAGSSGGEPAGGGELDAAAAGEEVVAEIVMIDEGVGGEEEEWSFQWPSSLDDLSEKWTDLPSRYRIIVGTCCAFILCNMVGKKGKPKRRRWRWHDATRRDARSRVAPAKRSHPASVRHHPRVPVDVKKKQTHHISYIFLTESFLFFFNHFYVVYV